MNNSLSSTSTEEEVVKYFVDNCQIGEEAQNNLIKENITGDILPLLSDDDFKNIIHMKFGELKKWKVYFKKNPDKFIEKEIKEKILPSSTKEEVKSFFENCLNFKEPVNDMDGKQLLDLNEEEMKKIGLNLGKRKKLIKYIKFFKTLIPKETKEEEEKYIITKKK